MKTPKKASWMVVWGAAAVLGGCGGVGKQVGEVEAPVAATGHCVAEGTGWREQVAVVWWTEVFDAEGRRTRMTHWSDASRQWPIFEEETIWHEDQKIVSEDTEADGSVDIRKTFDFEDGRLIGKRVEYPATGAMERMWVLYGEDQIVTEYDDDNSGELNRRQTETFEEGRVVSVDWWSPTETSLETNTYTLEAPRLDRVRTIDNSDPTEPDDLATLRYDEENRLVEAEGTDLGQYFHSFWTWEGSLMRSWEVEDDRGFYEERWWYDAEGFLTEHLQQYTEGGVVTEKHAHSFYWSCP